MRSSVFITAQELLSLQLDIKVVVVDCRHQLADLEHGINSYQSSHIPGSIFAHLDNDLSGEINETTGRHPLPLFDDFVHWLQENGIDPELTIVVYDDVGGGIAARLWWMLKQLTYPSVYILEGGFQSWTDLGYSTESGTETHSQIRLDLNIKSWDEGTYSIYTSEMIVKQDAEIVLIDSRAPERYSGENETIDKIPGRIPGATNLFWKANLNDKLHLIDELSDRVNSGLDIQKLSQSVFYCGSGVTACFNLAILAHLDLEKPAIYPGSYSDWIVIYPDNVERNGDN